MNKDRKKSIRILFIHVAILGIAGIAALFMDASGMMTWECGIHKIAGIYCLTCGATRAAVALGRFDIIGSVLFNPLPLILVCFLLVVIGYQLVCIIRNRRGRVEWLPWSVIIILGIQVVFCLLRNFGVIPGI